MAVAARKTKRMPLVRPVCAKCGATMVVYTTRLQGGRIVRYWRCWRYPKCKQTAKHSD